MAKIKGPNGLTVEIADSVASSLIESGLVEAVGKEPVQESTPLRVTVDDVKISGKKGKSEAEGK